MPLQTAHYPVISIVTPSFNQGAFLTETIESVIGQTGDFHIDYVIVDGGSTDNSVDIIKKYDTLLRDGHLPVRCRGISYRWLSEKDRGQSDAIIKGISMAEGGIIAWLNSDDVYLPGALQAAVDVFRLHPETGLLYGDAQYCDPSGNVIGKYRTEAFNFNKLAWFNFICQPSTFFRKEVYVAVGGLDMDLHYAMDLDLWIRIGKRFPCQYLPEYLSRYRLHETSKTIRVETLYESSEEALRLAMKYFRWAPLTRIYNSCDFSCRARLPRLVTGNRPALILATVICTLLRSLRLNRGIRWKDLHLLTGDNVRKLSRSRLEIMTGTTDAGSDNQQTE